VQQSTVGTLTGSCGLTEKNEFETKLITKSLERDIENKK
jgi:hypothetical protein